LEDEYNDEKLASDLNLDLIYFSPGALVSEPNIYAPWLLSLGTRGLCSRYHVRFRVRWLKRLRGSAAPSGTGFGEAEVAAPVSRRGDKSQRRYAFSWRVRDNLRPIPASPPGCSPRSRLLFPQLARHRNIRNNTPNRCESAICWLGSVIDGCIRKHAGWWVGRPRHKSEGSKAA